MHKIYVVRVNHALHVKGKWDIYVLIRRVICKMDGQGQIGGVACIKWPKFPSHLWGLKAHDEHQGYTETWFLPDSRLQVPESIGTECVCLITLFIRISIVTR